MSSPVRRVVVNVLAVVGALSIVAGAIKFTAHRYLDRGATGIVMGPGDTPAAGVPVFLDRGHMAIERYVTDAEGHFRLPLETREFPRAAWLICVPDGMPFVGHRDDSQIGPTTYMFTKLPSGPGAMVRAFGWRGPMPRECPSASDSMGWRYPASAGKDSSAFTTTEPDWTASASR